MANTTDDWLYNDDLDVGLPGRGRLDTDSQVLDGEDLLDDMLIAPSSATLRTDTPTHDDELLGPMSHDTTDTIIEDSGSARYNADRKARTVQARIEANLTSQGVAMTPGGLSIFSREPNRKNSFYIGNMNWWTTDLHLIAAAKEHGLGEVVCLKFFENRQNGQSKGYCLVEVASEGLALSATEKLSNVEIHDRKLTVTYALRVSPHQFESKCNQAKELGTTPVFSGSLSSPFSSGQNMGGPGVMKSNVAKTSLPGAIPPLPNPIFPQPPRPALPGFPAPPFAGLRPPGFPDFSGMGMGLPGMMPPPFPPIPNAPGMSPFTSRTGGLPTMPPIPPAALAALSSAAAAGGGDPTKLSAPHLNPAFLQEMTQSGANMAEMLAHAAARFRNQTAAFSTMGGGGGRASPADRGKSLPNHPSDEEISETNQRNKAISSSAITRAMSDAQSGDYESSIDTLRMAVTLIKQSVTASSEASQIMIQSLQDCLQGMEQQQQASIANKRYRSSGGGIGRGGGGGGGGGGGREHMGARHVHEMRERDMREIREMREMRDIRDVRDFRDERGMRSSHKMSKHHRDRSRERRR